DPVRLEPGLADAVLDGVKSGAIELETAGRGRLDAPSGPAGAAPEPEKEPIEAAYLQLVMTRVWDEERPHGSRVLRWETFKGLGEAKGIVQKSLGEILGRLPVWERVVAEEVLTSLVTPSGTKIALEPSYLSEKAGYRPWRVQAVLDHLIG